MNLNLKNTDIINLINIGKLEEAEVKIVELLIYNPNDIFLLNLHAVVNYKKGFLDKSIEQFKKILEINPASYEALFNIGTILLKKLKFKDAVDYLNSAINLKKDYFDAHFNIAECYKNLENFDDAILSLETCRKINPNDLEIYNNLGLFYKQINKFDFSINNFKKTLEINPNFYQGYNNLGVVYLEKDQLDEAIDLFNKCIQINQGFVEAYNNLGMALNKKKKYHSAILILEHGLRIDPNFKNIFINLAIAYEAVGRVFEAIKLYEKETDTYKTDKILMALGNCWCSIGEIAKGLDYYEESIKLNPENLPVYQNYISNLNYLENFKIEDYFNIIEKMKLILKKYEDQEVKGIYNTNSDKKIKIGFVTADFRKHAVGFQVFDVIKNLAKNNDFELYAYYNENTEDILTENFKLLFKSWVNIFSMDNLQIIKKIKQDNIKILVDLSGYTAGNRIEVFFNKPAQIQVSWAGYLASTGLKEIDYIIADQNSVNFDKQQENQFVEKIWRMTNCWSVLSVENDILAQEQDIIIPDEIPAIKNGYLTFGCFNNLNKINKEVINIWSRILIHTKGKLFLKTKEFDIEGFREKIKLNFLQNGVNDNQLILEGSSDRNALLKKYNMIDLALDPFPYNGGTTSLECSWMCVPILAKVGDRFLSKCGESINKSLGLTECIAKNNEEYVSIAINYSKNLKSLQKVKEYLIQNRSKFKIFNSQDFADELGNSFKKMLN
jgi:predicted O-linked N-acetylglucosamine transferase (SPINDLY family)